MDKIKLIGITFDIVSQVIVTVAGTAKWIFCIFKLDYCYIAAPVASFFFPLAYKSLCVSDFPDCKGFQVKTLFLHQARFDSPLDFQCRAKCPH